MRLRKEVLQELTADELTTIQGADRATVATRCDPTVSWTRQGGTCLCVLTR